MSARRVHRPFVVAEEGGTALVWLGLDESDVERGILTNQYLLVSRGEAMLLDPGGLFVFERVVSAVQEYVDPGRVRYIFYSHQDPDVAGSLSVLLDFFPEAEVVISELWVRFLPHLTGSGQGIRFRPVPDEGGRLRLGGEDLLVVPAHFLHSPGHINLYIPGLRALFSGDIGAAIFPPGEWYLFVEDFDRHARLMEWFHRRFMASSRAVRRWVERVRRLGPEIIAPQHGAIMQGEAARRFLDWLESLGPVGADLL